MKWITREHVKVDRVACPWLIKKFIDREAEFIFLPRDTDWANLGDGIVCDVPNCELGHHGEDVSFDSIQKKYKLSDPALILLGELYTPQIRAQRIRIRPAKDCAGLPMALVAGPQRPRNLDREFIVYDALVCGVPAAGDFDRLNLVWNTATRLGEFFGLKRNVCHPAPCDHRHWRGRGALDALCSKVSPGARCGTLHHRALRCDQDAARRDLRAGPVASLLIVLGIGAALVAFNVVSIIGYTVVLLVPHWGAVLAGTFLFLAWSCFLAAGDLLAHRCGAPRAEARDGHWRSVGRSNGCRSSSVQYAAACSLIALALSPACRWSRAITIMLGIAAIFLQRRIVEEKSGHSIPGRRFLASHARLPPTLRPTALE